MHPLRTLLIAAVLASVTPMSAHATDAFKYQGGCSLKAVNDATNRWNGIVTLAAVPTDMSGRPLGNVGVTAWCDLHVNGDNLGTVLGRRYGTGAAFDAGQVPTFAAQADGSVFELCDYVKVGNDTVSKCHAGQTTEATPEQAYDAACFIFSEAFCDTLKGSASPTVLTI